MSIAQRGSADVSASLSFRAGLVVVSGAIFGFFIGSAVVLLHPILVGLVGSAPWSLGELAAQSLDILPEAMAIFTLLGAGLGALYALVRAVSPHLAATILRMAVPLWPLVLCLMLMFGYDSKTFSYNWFRALAWALAAWVLAWASYRFFRMLLLWLQTGHVKRMTGVVLVAAILVWLPFLIRCVGF